MPVWYKATWRMHKSRKARLKPAQQQSSASGPTRQLRRIPGWIYAVIVFAALVITLLEGYPWLSVQEGVSLDPRNPYSELFAISNGGYAPVSDLDASCEINLVSKLGVRATDSVVAYPKFADYLGHGGIATIPCFDTVSLDSNLSGVIGLPPQDAITQADLRITITYSFYPITYKPLRRHQAFNFRGIRSADGSLKWSFVS